MAKVSILMPVYNAAKYINNTIDSVEKQTFNDWELIIMDDCSTDASYDISCARATKNPKIKVYKMGKNSGCSHIPRCHAESKSNGDYIVQLDADDYLESNYLEKLYTTMIDKHVDMVIPRIIHIDDNGTIYTKIPDDSFDFSKVISGKDALMQTIPDWKINGLGMFKRQLSNIAKNNYVVEDKLINACEYLGRKRMFYSNSVAFSDAIYYFRNNPTSVTHVYTVRHLGFIETSRALRDMIGKEFGKDTIDYEKANYFLYRTIMEQLKLCTRFGNKLSPSDKQYALSIIKSNWNKIDSTALGELSARDKLKFNCGYKVLLPVYEFLYFIYRTIKK